MNRMSKEKRRKMRRLAPSKSTSPDAQPDIELSARNRDQRAHLMTRIEAALKAAGVDLVTAPVVDTRTTTSFVDSYVYIVEWGRTKIEAAKHSLSNAPEVYDRLLGVVLNKADMSILQRYEPYGTNYYERKYTQYKNVD